MIVRYQWEITVWYLVIIGIVLTILFYISGLARTHGYEDPTYQGLVLNDTDKQQSEDCPNGWDWYCAHGLFNQELLNRMHEWNTWCNPVMIDEVYCLTGKHDPDWEDEK